MAHPTIPCFRCNGTGVYKGESCDGCIGTGLIAPGDIHLVTYAYVRTLFLQASSAIKPIFAYQIVEVINATEYAALVDAAKDGLRIILSCGVVDLVHTGNIYLNLMAIFGSSPITKAAIEAL